MPLNDLSSHEEVRLFPCHHIRSEREAELRATASFLATTRAVSEFGRSVVAMAGGPKGKISCYAEVCFKHPNNPKAHKDRLDGILQSTRGKKTWAAIVEVKVGNNVLEQEQFDRYHTLAKDQDMDAFITISNQPALANGLTPGVKPDKWRLKTVPVVHISWERLLSEAQRLSCQKAIADPDQQWILEEWIRYLKDKHSRIIEPPQMGEHWNEVLRYAREGNLGACRGQMRDVVKCWNAFLKTVALRLRAKLGVEVILKMSKAESKDPSLRIKNLLEAAIQDGQLLGIFRIPDAAGDLSVTVLLAPRCVQYSTDIKAPTEGTTARRIKWLLKQLHSDDVPDDLVVQVDWGWRLSSQGRMKDLKEQIDALLVDNKGQTIPKNTYPNRFTLLWTQKLVKCRGRSSVPVLEDIEQRLDEFYGSVVEGIKPFVPKAPKLREEQVEEEHAAKEGTIKRSGTVPEQSIMPLKSVDGDISLRDGSIDAKTSPVIQGQ